MGLWVLREEPGCAGGSRCGNRGRRWPVYADYAVAGICRLWTGRDMPLTPWPVYADCAASATAPRWPDYADSEMA